MLLNFLTYKYFSVTFHFALEDKRFVFFVFSLSRSVYRLQGPQMRCKAINIYTLYKSILGYFGFGKIRTGIKWEV